MHWMGRSDGHVVSQPQAHADRQHRGEPWWHQDDPKSTVPLLVRVCSCTKWYSRAELFTNLFFYVIMHKQECKHYKNPSGQKKRQSLITFLFCSKPLGVSTVWPPLRPCVHPDLYAKSYQYPIQPSAATRV